MAQVGSATAWPDQLRLAQLGFCFTIFSSEIFSPKLASSSPKPFGHVVECGSYNLRSPNIHIGHPYKPQKSNKFDFSDVCLHFTTV